MEKSTAKKNEEILREMGNRLWSAVRITAKKVGRLTFWGMALLCFALRLFMVYPLGACAATVVGCVWFY